MPTGLGAAGCRMIGHEAACAAFRNPASRVGSYPIQRKAERSGEHAVTAFVSPCAESPWHRMGPRTSRPRVGAEVPMPTRPAAEIHRPLFVVAGAAAMRRAPVSDRKVPAVGPPSLGRALSFKKREVAVA